MASTPDRVTAPPPGEGGASKFAPHSATTKAFICVDVVDLGQKVDTYPGKPSRLVHRAALVFASGERHEDDAKSLITVQQEFALSTYETSALRKFVEGWYNRTFTDEQLANGFALHKLVGRPILLSIEHKKSGKGRAYAKIKSHTPVPDGMPGPDAAALLAEYERGPYWAKMKEEYAKEAATFSAQKALADAMPVPGAGEEYDGFPGQLDEEEDDLPFD